MCADMLTGWEYMTLVSRLQDGILESATALTLLERHANNFKPLLLWHRVFRVAIILGGALRSGGNKRNPAPFQHLDHLDVFG